MVNGVKTVKDQVHALGRYWDILDPIMGSRSVKKTNHLNSMVTNDKLKLARCGKKNCLNW
ncbi:hypothetical protein VP01_5906g2 [Puccinia sorghi]|uniref:Uncharacterized protein n=1 Tax=Puccinia sorghi TaxID=27349 RepID=A0A0L6UHS0_9BASI|nr:hypothetical protein VP01_5906g2 [Puccinia sorghi]